MGPCLLKILPFFKDTSYLFRYAWLPISNSIISLYLHVPTFLFIRLTILFYSFFSTLLYAHLLAFVVFRDTKWNKQGLLRFLVWYQPLLIFPFLPLYLYNPEYHQRFGKQDQNAGLPWNFRFNIEDFKADIIKEQLEGH